MAKYDSLRKIERNQALIEYAESHPDISLDEIGKMFDNISSQRVSAILRKAREKQNATYDIS